jgi:stearoyl-CoA desaturase (delta-9 desaturase)
MSRYSKTLKAAFNLEVQTMKSLAKEFADNHQWLFKDEANLNPLQKARLETLMGVNERIRHLIEMRRELTQLWTKSTASREQLTEQLHHWCLKAEKSNLQLLQTFSQKLKTYA